MMGLFDAAWKQLLADIQEQKKREDTQMRRWLVEETGEFRPPKEGEWYLEMYHRYASFQESSIDCGLHPAKILRVTELPKNICMWECTEPILFTPLTDRFDEWNW